MKIKTLLENAYPASDIQFSDLSPEQVGLLIKMSKGEVDVDSASDSQFDMMTELRGMGLLDQEWGLSREGSAAARYAEETGGSHDLQKARDRSERSNEVDAELEFGETGELDSMDIDDTSVFDDDDAEITDAQEFKFSM